MEKLLLIKSKTLDYGVEMSFLRKLRAFSLKLTNSRFWPKDFYKTRTTQHPLFFVNNRSFSPS